MNRKNHEKYNDPTPYDAIKNIDAEEKQVDKVIKTLQNVAHLAGYDIDNRIVLKNHKTGRIWR